MLEPAAGSIRAQRFPLHFYAFFFPEPMKASLFSIIAAHRYEHCR